MMVRNYLHMSRPLRHLAVQQVVPQQKVWQWWVHQY